MERRRGNWIGWERKRGKLHELNRLHFAVPRTRVSSPLPAARHKGARSDSLRYHPRFRYPHAARHTVRRLVGKMAHPINRPRFDPDAGRGRRSRRPAASRDAVVSNRRGGFAVSAGLFQPQRHRPLCRRRLRRVSGSLSAEGSSRRARASTMSTLSRPRWRTSAGLNTSQPRSVRRRFCPRRPGIRHRSR